MVTYRDLPDHSRVWVYQANREFSKEDCSEIKQLSENFLTGWNAHGSKLNATSMTFTSPS